MAKEDVHACVIVGGSSLIPIIQEQLISTLGLKELTRNLDVYEAAALGAGFYAAGQPRASDTQTSSDRTDLHARIEAVLLVVKSQACMVSQHRHRHPDLH